MAKSHTGSSCPYGNIQRCNKVRENRIHLIQSCNDIYYVGTRIRVLLWKGSGEESCCSLFHQPRPESRDAWIPTSRACASAGALPALMQPTALENNCRVCAYMRISTLNFPFPISASYLEVQKVVRAQFENDFLQGGFVRFQEKELLPVSLGLLVVFLILQSGQRIELPPRMSSPSPP